MLKALKQLQSPLNASIDIQGQSYLYFGGTAYLGIPQNQGFLGHYMEGVKRFGINNGTSRNNNIQLGIYAEAEDYAASHFGAQAAALMSSGYLAVQMTTRHFAPGNKVLYAPQSHPSLWLSAPERRDMSFTAWSKAIVEEINQSPERNFLIISNSLNNLYPEYYDFSFLKEILPENQITLIVDDSHGIGLIHGGLGIYNRLPKLDHVKVLVVASMAKALGVDAGIVLGDVNCIKAVKGSNEFVGASPPAAAGLYAFMQSKAIYEEELNKLYDLSGIFSARLAQDWDYAVAYPVFRSTESNLFGRLLAKNMLISAFPYPNADSEPVNRIVLSSWHTKAQLNTLLNAL